MRHFPGIRTFPRGFRTTFTSAVTSLRSSTLSFNPTLSSHYVSRDFLHSFLTSCTLSSMSPPILLSNLKTPIYSHIIPSKLPYKNSPPYKDHSSYQIIPHTLFPTLYTFHPPHSSYHTLPPLNFPPLLSCVTPL